MNSAAEEGVGGSDLREELIEVMRQVAMLHPNWRIGQIVCNLATWAGLLTPAGPWDVSDAELLQAAREHLQQHGVSVTPANSARR
jgi:hypothetical protein